jgi:hypothetical protein
MRIRFVGAIAFVASVWAVGCSSSAPDAREGAVGAASQAIQGGTSDTTHTFAVGVCGGDGPAQCHYTCSGALIAPNLVVTARHCVDETLLNGQPSEVVDCSATTFGQRLPGASQYWITTSDSMHQATTGWHQVAQIVTPTATKMCGNDIALLILSKTIAASEATPITPAVQYPITDHNRYTTSETAIGYGLSAPTPTSGPQPKDTSGYRRIKQNISVLCIPNDPDAQLDCFKLDPQATQALAASEFEAGDGTCQGDSGSSAYEQSSFNAGKPVSLGVLSRGGVDDPNNPTTCVGSVYTRLDSWRDLIVQTVTTAAANGNYPLPSWTEPVTAPPADGGAATTDSGTHTPAPGSLGAPCNSDKQCDSNQCLGIPDSSPTSFVCTKDCDEKVACDQGFVCKNGDCFKGEAPAPTAQSLETTQSGCSIGLVADPTNPMPWRALGAGILAGVAFVRRRRSRG